MCTARYEECIVQCTGNIYIAQSGYVQETLYTIACLIVLLDNKIQNWF